MRKFGKRLFTRLCKAVTADDRGLKRAVRLRLGRLFLFVVKGCFCRVFGEKCVQDVVILWFGCGGLCGEDGLLDVGFWWVDFLQS